MATCVSNVSLPIHKYKQDILKAIENSQSLVIVGETGSGKSTQLPQFLYEAGYGKYGLVGITQPRRVAAISVASRVAEEMQCTLGHEVGYQVRFDDRTSKDTAIKYMTDGCLLREFLEDKELSRYSIIVLDEAHERSLDTDILFGLVKQLFLSSQTPSCKMRRRPLKVVVMSATLDRGKFSDFLGGCPVFEIPGRLHPVKNVFCELIEESNLRKNLTLNYVAKVVDTVLDVHLEQKCGDILVFLTGQAEIERACDAIFEKSERIDYQHDVKDSAVEALMVLPVYGSMATDAQRRIFLPADPGVRKCVVATNIAGTSLTINGIKYVVDSGFVKQLSFNPRTGLDTLQVVPISRSEAIQRSGRAGRTSPGKCYRIYTKGFYENVMSEDMVPEIQRTSLTSIVLNLKCMGIHNILEFPYVDCPGERMMLEALRQLYYFGAIDKDGRISSLGRLMVEYPLPPGLARSVIYSGALKCQELMLPVAAMLSVENVFMRPGDKAKQKEAVKAHTVLAETSGNSNDFATLLAVYRNYTDSGSSMSWCRKNYIHLRAVKMAVSIHQQLDSIVSRQIKTPNFPKERVLPNSTYGDLFGRSLCAGLFCNVARKWTSGRGFRTMEGHGTFVFVHPSSQLFGRDDLDWVIYHEVVCTSKVYMRTVCSVKYEWVKDLLPRIHELDVYALSGCLAPKIVEAVDETEIDDTKQSDSTCKHSTELPEEMRVQMGKRNDNNSVAEARRRYLERKRAKLR